MSGTIMLGSKAEDESGQNAGDRLLLFGSENKDLAAGLLCLLHPVRFDRTRRQRYFPRTCLL